MKKLLLIATVLLLNTNIVNTQDYWETISTPPDINIYSIEVNLNEDIYTGTSETTGGGVYRSTNDGINWEFLGIESKTIYSLEINELEYIYSGSNIGLSNYSINRSIDNGLCWEGVYEGSPNVICINDIQMDYYLLRRYWSQCQCYKICRLWRDMGRSNHFCSKY